MDRCTGIERDGRRCNNTKIRGDWYRMPVCKRHLRRMPRRFRSLGKLVLVLNRWWPAAIACFGGEWFLSVDHRPFHPAGAKQGTKLGARSIIKTLLDVESGRM
jgi:hypothetical protein